MFLNVMHAHIQQEVIQGWEVRTGSTMGLKMTHFLNLKQKIWCNLGQVSISTAKIHGYLFVVKIAYKYY